MKRLTMILALLLVFTLAMPAIAETPTYGEAPMLTELVEAGELPPVEERLPEVPKLSSEMLDEHFEWEIGKYGGTLKHVTDDVNWDADVFVACDEALFTCASANSGEVTPNLLEDVQINEDNTEFIFKLRKGLKWSDGTEVTMEDFRFTIEDFIFNTTLTPVISNLMRSGSSSDGEPFTYEFIDDEHFAIRFDSSYGGFLVAISISGWAGYTDYLKPAHYLKPFHLDYAEEIHGSEDAYYEFLAPYAKVMGYDDPKAEGVWTYVFHQIDVTNWEITDPMDCLPQVYFKDAGHDKNMPMLYAWIMSDTDGTITTWTRNPYYHKVDPEGNQLPYIDKLTSLLVQDGEMVQMAYITGDADFGQGVTMIDNLGLYRENEETSGNYAYLAMCHNNPTDLFININYGLNPDGTIKEDDLSKAWQETVADVRFREALSLSIDAEEIIDSVYSGFASVNPYFNCVHDIETANDILDELGCLDVDGDGWRESPSGLPLKWDIMTDAAATDQVPVCELITECWKEIGLNVGVQTVDPTLLSTMQGANECTMRVTWGTTTQTWHYLDFGERVWGPLFQTWLNNGGLEADKNGETVEGIEPPEGVKEIYRQIARILTATPEVAVNEVMPEVMAAFSSQYVMIEPIIDVMQCVVIDSDIGNVPTGGLSIGWSFAREQMFFNNPESH